MKRVSTGLLLVLILAGCAALGADSGAGQTPARQTPDSPTPADQVAGETPDTPQPDSSAAEAAAREALAALTGYTPEEIVTQSIVEAGWPDACLGVSQEGVMCAQVITPGYAFFFAVAGQTYEVRTDQSGGVVQIPTASPEGGASEDSVLVTLEYDARLAGCQRVVITAQDIAAGECGAEPTLRPLSEDFITDNLAFFLTTYAPFSAETMGGYLVFNGQGTTEATPAEQRMLAGWARASGLLATAGDEGGAARVPLMLRREGGLAGVCEDVTIWASGEVSITTCTGENLTATPDSRLNSAQLETLYSWVDTYTDAVADLDEDVPVDGLANHLVFNGLGDVLPGQAEQEAMLAFVDEVYAQHVGFPTVTGCVDVAPGKALFSDEGAGYCLNYPEGFEVATPEAGVVVIAGPDYGLGPEPLRGFVNISSFDAESRTAPEISDELVAPFLPDIMVERVDAQLGGEPAVEMIGMPGQALSWQVVVVHGDRAYLLVFSPLGEEYGQTTLDMEALYQSIMTSFTFLP